VQYISWPQHRDQNRARTFVAPDQPSKILSPKLVTNQRRDITRGIQSKFVYQSTSPNYYEPVEN
jgi:hypothetical protein